MASESRDPPVGDRPATPDGDARPSEVAERATTRRRLWGLLFGLAVGVGVLVALLGEPLDLDTLRRHGDFLTSLRESHPALTALAFVAAYALIVTLSLPGALVMSLAGGWLFGPWLGALANLAGASIGAIALFYLVRKGVGDFFLRRIDGRGGRAEEILAGLRRDEVSYLLAMRLLPAVPFFMANVLPALVGVRLRNYVLTTVIGIFPGTLIVSHVGAGLGRLFAAGMAPDPTELFSWQTLLPLLGLAVLVLLPALWRNLRKKT